MKIADRLIDHDRPPYIIAELGVNHDGSVDRAVDLVHAAHRAGADAVKLQLFKSEQLLSRAARLAAYQEEAGAADPFEMLRGLELDHDAMTTIVEHARSLGLHAIVSIFSLEMAGPAAPGAALAWDAFKIASPDVINKPLIDAIVRHERPVIVSTGAASIDEVERAATWLTGRDFALLHCVSAYPAPEEHAALGGIEAIRHLVAKLDVSPTPPVGYSDHTTAIDTGALAVAAGACLLEKHLTHDRAAPGPDHAASLDPEGFARYVSLAHRAHAMRGPAVKRVLEVEQDVRTVSRQSIVAMRDLAAGHALARDDLTIKRPGTGLPAFELDEVVGRALARDVAGDTPLSREDLA